MANKKLTEVDVSTSLDSIFVNDGGKVRQINKENINNIIKGVPGKSAYEYAQDGGYTGTEEEFAQKLAGDIQLDPTLTDSTKAAPADVVGGLKSQIGNLVSKKQGTENSGKALIVDENGNVICGEAGVSADVTLSEEGKAADAKATGDAISELKSDLSESSHYIKELRDNDAEIRSDVENLKNDMFGKSILYNPVYNKSFNGTGLSIDASNRIITDYIKLDSGDQITIKNGSLQHSCGMWLGSVSSANCIRNDSAWQNDETFDCQFNGYMVVLWRKTSNEDISISEFDGSIEVSRKNTYAKQKDVESLAIKLNDFTSKNLCGIDCNQLYPVDLKNGDKITLSTSDGSVTDKNYNIMFFDENKKYITAYSLLSGTNMRTITLKCDVKYMTWNKKFKVPLQIEYGVQATDYKEYIYKNNELKSFIESGYYNLYPLTNGSWESNSLSENKMNRLRLQDFISVKTGNKIIIKNGSFYHAIGLWDSSMNRYRSDNVWIKEDEELEIDKDGYAIIVFSKPSDEDISISEFDGSIELYTRNITIKSETIKGNDEMILNNKIFSVYNPYKNMKCNKYKGQLHCHTTNSDGKWSVDKLMAKYSEAGYDFITITDHNYITEEPSDLHGMVWLGNSLEDTHNEAGYQHCNIFRAKSVVNKINVINNTNTVVSMVNDYIKLQDAVMQYNHPDDPVVYVSDEDLDNMPNGISFVEIYNSCDIAWKKTIQTKSELPVSGNKVNDLYYVEEDGKKYRNINLDPDSMVNVWQETTREPVEQERGITHLLDAGKKVFGTATDDCHCNSLFNYGWVQVFANRRSKTDIWNNLLNGNFYASCGVELSSVCVEDGQYTIDIENGDNAKTVFYGKGLEVLKICKGSVATYDFDGSEKYVRAMVQIGDKKAWTQPVWLIEKKYNFEF